MTTVNNPPKFWLLVIALVGVFVLLAFGKIEPAYGTGIIGTIVGYGVGNGIAAKNDEPVAPVFARKRTNVEALEAENAALRRDLRDRNG